METKTHLLINTTIGLVSVKLGIIDWTEALFFAGSYVLDFDHIFEHMIENKSISLNKFLATHRKYRDVMMPRFYIFHTAEFLSALSLFAIFSNSNFVQAFATGWFLHIICDISKYIWYYKSDFSWINYWVLCKWRNLK